MHCVSAPPMALCVSSPPSHPSPSSLRATARAFSHVSLFLVFFLAPPASPVSFNFSGFRQTTQGILYHGDAFPSPNGVLQLTKNQRDASITNSSGRATYAERVLLWDSETGKVTDFVTHFSFVIKALNSTVGDGLAFFLAPFGSDDVPPDSFGGYLGLFSKASAHNSSANRIVAVEFDTCKNPWDPSSDHVGIDVNSIESVVTLPWSGNMKTGTTGHAWVSYNSTSKNLSLFLTYAENAIFLGKWSLSYAVDLKEILPEWVSVGFSAATGDWIEVHNILEWEFSSTLEVRKKTRSVWLLTAIFAGLGLVAVSVLAWLFVRKKRASREGKEDDAHLDSSIDQEFEKGRGPKRFPYPQLVAATNGFSQEGKLGEGGFGSVYRGFLSDVKLDVAIKRVSRRSTQGRKEYVSEVKIISRLRHRNLVQLIGWCHDRGEFLLVYEFMPNGSLDSHLFGGKKLLSWPTRYKIALGLASALLYLHEEWEQCVVHRDVKSSNLMLDSNFNAKLGDFGLARLVDHDQASQTTVLAGTMGYLAPECVTTGKASKESDVYSFGVVALEIACGRRSVEPQEQLEKVRLVEWVWGWYGRGRVVEAADGRLGGEADEKEMARLMVVGLWCAHPDCNARPSIRQAIAVLNSEAALPKLPPQMPVAMFYAPPMEMCRFSYTSSSETAGGIAAAPTATSAADSAGFSSGTTNSSTSTASSSASSTSCLLPSRAQID